ncbi:sigma-70 family RNA polymerase sigma factor [Pseudoroseicyclus tamaricis]
MGSDAGQDERAGEAQPRALCEQTKQMLAVRDGRDRAAFGALFDHYAPRLKAMAIRGGATPALAEDIVQDVMLTIWRKAAQYDPARAPVSAWIFRIARNRQIDIARRSRRPEPEALDNAPEPASGDAGAGDILGLEQEAEALGRALLALTPEQRAVIERAYLGDLTHSEIHAETGLPLGTIKSRIRLGLDRLRHELKDLRS